MMTASNITALNVSFSAHERSKVKAGKRTSRASSFSETSGPRLLRAQNALTKEREHSQNENENKFLKMVSSEAKMNALRAMNNNTDNNNNNNNNTISIDQSILKVDSYSENALDYIGSQKVQTPVNFSVQYDTKWGENLFVLGSHKKLGAWDESKAIAMYYSEGGKWQCDLELQPGGIFFYKYLVKSIFGTRWQEGANNLLVLPEVYDLPKNATYLVEDCFNGGPTQLTRTNQTLLAAKLIETQKEKVIYAKELSKQQQMTKSALEELLVAREELALAQNKLRLLGDGTGTTSSSLSNNAVALDSSTTIVEEEQELKKGGFWSSR